MNNTRTGGSTSSRFDKQSEIKSLRLPRSRGTQSVTDERIREYTIRKIIKTEFFNTSFYRFLLLRIEAASPSAIKIKSPNFLGFYFIYSTKYSLCMFLQHGTYLAFLCRYLLNVDRPKNYRTQSKPQRPVCRLNSSH